MIAIISRIYLVLVHAVKKLTFKKYINTHVVGVTLCVFDFVTLNFVDVFKSEAFVLLITMTFIVCVGCVAYSFLG